MGHQIEPMGLLGVFLIDMPCFTYSLWGMMWGNDIFMQQKRGCEPSQTPDLIIGDPSGIRTRVTGVRGRRPKPLDDGTILKTVACL